MIVLLSCKKRPMIYIAICIQNFNNPLHSFTNNLSSPASSIVKGFATPEAKFSSNIYLQKTAEGIKK